jgi:hypothetical protein
LPLETVALAGVIVMLTRTAAVLVSVVDPTMLPSVAEMVVVPRAVAVASPPVLMLADGALEFQIETLVTSWWEPSVSVPIASNCAEKPTGREEFAGVTAIELSSAAVTVSALVPVTEPKVAETVVAPVPTLDAKPVLLITATVGADDVQLLVVVKSSVEPSE